MNHSSKKAVTMTEIALMLQMVQMETLLAAASKGEIFEEIKWKLMPRNLRYPRQYLPARTTLTNKTKRLIQESLHLSVWWKTCAHVNAGSAVQLGFIRFNHWIVRKRALL
jgi:hypothetical protein